MKSKIFRGRMKGGVEVIVKDKESSSKSLEIAFQVMVVGLPTGILKATY